MASKQFYETEPRQISLVSGFKYENIWAKIGKTKIWESKKQKFLVVEIDRTLSFDEYIASLCKKAGKKLSVLARLSNFVCTNMRRVLMKALNHSLVIPL